MNSQEEAKRILEERFGKDSVIALATISHGTPYARNVNAVYRNGAFYSITHDLSNKMRQIAEHSTVAIAGDWFTGHGEATNLGYIGKPENRAIADALREAFHEWIDNGHTDFSDENTVILCVKLTDGILFSHGRRFDMAF
ncbi:MAG: pyridoxamine 5'-phosphate oxidase family protein [Clostridia bacterium]|nr:pyridoxamine 5'-phosphate oxidase family protein [Clostridia bacterium]